MELKDRVQQQVKAGRHNDRYTEYKNLYEEITAKTYSSGCGSCACKFLYRYLQDWLKTK